MTTQRIAFIFPGQGSQSLNMLQDDIDHPIVKQTFEEANQSLGFDLAKIIISGSIEELNQTQITQPALLTVSTALYRIWESEKGSSPIILAGHSLGEYSALVASKSIDFSQAVKLVSLRGKFMQEAVPSEIGAMAAILGLDDVQVIDLCKQFSTDDYNQLVQAVNFNSPGQVVIAGHKSAVEKVCAEAKNIGAKRALLLPVSVPSHCLLMKPAAEKLAVELDKIQIHSSIIPVIHNVDVCTYSSPQLVKKSLINQLFSPVQWSKSILAFNEYSVTDVIECGSGKVLTGLVKRINSTLNCFNITDIASLKDVLAKLG